ncbi:hypothetical protein KSP39_PZI023968 [Platanthera zijinensis]|uniref:Uncharacterized protein n=1 Tax=Platanthera zijinensis TaxID=2320716 RepID=A0AAP0ATA1_9ASPA
MPSVSMSDSLILSDTRDESLARGLMRDSRVPLNQTRNFCLTSLGYVPLLDFPERIMLQPQVDACFLSPGVLANWSLLQPLYSSQVPSGDPLKPHPPPLTSSSPPPPPQPSPSPIFPLGTSIQPSFTASPAFGDPNPGPYGYVGPDDVPALLEQHIGKGEIIDHLWREWGKEDKGRKRKKKKERLAYVLSCELAGMVWSCGSVGQEQKKYQKKRRLWQSKIGGTEHLSSATCDGVKRGLEIGKTTRACVGMGGGIEACYCGDSDRGTLEGDRAARQNQSWKGQDPSTQVDVVVEMLEATTFGRNNEDVVARW